MQLCLQAQYTRQQEPYTVLKSVIQLYMVSGLAGTLPSSWGNSGAFPSLISLTLFDMALTGPLPASWAGNGSFPALQSVGIGADLAGPRLACMSGPMPAEWGSPSAFQQLEIVTFRVCVEGEQCNMEQ